jgi:AraC-like DNA-binding protein
VDKPETLAIDEDGGDHPRPERPHAASGGASSGLYRSLLSGPGSTIRDAFDALGKLPGMELSRDSRAHRLIARIPNPVGQGYWTLYKSSRDLFVVASRCRFSCERTEIVPAEGFVEFHLSLSGHSGLRRNGTEPVAVDGGTLAICRQGAGAFYQAYCAVGERLSVSLFVDPEFLAARYDARVLLGWLLPPPRPNEIALQASPLPASAAELAAKLIEDRFTGERRLIAYESLVQLLLCECLALVESGRSDNCRETLRKRDILLFEKAREIILTEQEHWTIASLARRLGTNGTKLKSGFKLMYGVTVFEFAQRHRMQKAMDMLITDKPSIAKIAWESGYQHQASFAAAFKKFFGIMPKEARRLTKGGAGG